MAKYFLGINGSFHNAAVCLLDENNNELALLCSEDHHSGIPHHQGFPWISLNNAINKAGGPDKITSIGYSQDKVAYRNPPINYFSEIVNYLYENDYSIIAKTLLDTFFVDRNEDLGWIPQAMLRQ
tara:strand:- start:209 stop:583 length:375 start_codon:yes stop_codon:yes gene_type:complete